MCQCSLYDIGIATILNCHCHLFLHWTHDLLHTSTPNKKICTMHVTPANWPVVENFYIASYLYSDTLWYTDLNDVLTVCERCILHLLIWWHKVWVWTWHNFQLIFTSTSTRYRINKTNKPKTSKFRIKTASKKRDDLSEVWSSMISISAYHCYHSLQLLSSDIILDHIIINWQISDILDLRLRWWQDRQTCQKWTTMCIAEFKLRNEKPRYHSHTRRLDCYYFYF
jgi:hypothetical protein